MRQSHGRAACGERVELGPRARGRQVNVERQIASVRELAAISRAAGRPASFQPLLTVPLDPTRRDVIGVMEEEALTGARVMAPPHPSTPCASVWAVANPCDLGSRSSQRAGLRV